MLLKVLPVSCLFIITAVFRFYLPTKLYDFTILATGINDHYLTFTTIYLFLTKTDIYKPRRQILYTRSVFVV